MSNRNIFVISDTHFGHSNIIKNCNRPFKSSEEMDEIIIQNWNNVVKDQDTIYHLGDVYFSNSSNFQYRLKGRKRLILGNHDNGKDQTLHKMFEKISVWRMFPEFKILLTHVPVFEDTILNHPKLLLNVHGHIHEKVIDKPHYRNVSVEQIDYTPINIEELIIRQ